MDDSLQFLNAHYSSLSRWGAGAPATIASSKLQYYQLSALRNEIRLLVLEPSHDPHQYIQCRLDHVPLDQANHAFVALSYTWGDTEQRSRQRQVLLNDTWSDVTANLHRALVELRSRGYLTIWADSLCINQDDLEERSQMVLRMGMIYRSATMVVSYLDASDPSDIGRSVLASHLLTRVLQRLKTWKPTTQDGKRIRNLTSDDLESRMAAFTDEMCSRAISDLQIEDDERRAVAHLLHHRYWFRAWIIQEISMNTRLKIIWARNEFDLAELAAALRALQHVQGIGSSGSRQHIQQLADIRKSQLELRSLSLVEALHRCNLAHATLTQDRLYALLGLAHDGLRLVPFPSYEWELMHISLDITKRYIQATGNLDLVVLHIRTNAHYVWYPNWFIRETWVNQSPFDGPAARPNWFRPDSRWPSYSASRKEKAQAEFAWKHVTVKGFALGSISSCSPTLKEAKASGLPGTHITKKRVWKPEEETSKVFVSPAQLTTSLRWLLVDFSAEGPRSGSNLAPRKPFGKLHKLLNKRKEKLIEYAPDLMQWMNCCEKESFGINGQPFVGYFSRKNETGPPKGFKDICGRFQSNLEGGMRLCSLGASGLLGWLPEGARIGDEVFVLLGSSMPCVLRRIERTDTSCPLFYRVVGPCYVDGAMYGEMVKKGVQKLQNVVLQ